MPLPKVSIIVPAYNGASFYESAVGSILQQNFPDVEIVVVDDGSVDGLDELVRQGTAAVRYLRQARKGPAAARNTGLRASSGELIAFLDIDDLWTAGHLARLCAALAEDPAAGIAQGLVRQFVLLPDGGRMLSGAYRMPYLGSCLFRRQVVEQCDGFDEDMAMGEDYDLMCRCWEHDVLKRDVDEVSLLYRRHEGNMTRGKNQAANLAVLQRRMQRIRSGAIDPAAPRRFVFQAYIGEIRNFAETHVEMPGQWTLSSAS
jgi:glycosyltransferase involved in cell wall biosynthesis